MTSRDNDVDALTKRNGTKPESPHVDAMVICSPQMDSHGSEIIRSTQSSWMEKSSDEAPLLRGPILLTQMCWEEVPQIDEASSSGRPLAHHTDPADPLRSVEDVT